MDRLSVSESLTKELWNKARHMHMHCLSKIMLNTPTS